MRRTMFVVALLAVPVGAVMAQDKEERRGEQPGRRGPMRGPSIQRIIDRMNEQLAFDEEQLMRIEEIVASHEQRMREGQARRESLRTAREAGDEQRVAELREQFRQERESREGVGERGRGRSGMESVLNEIEPLLHEDQREPFEQMRERFTQRQGPGDRGRMGEMRQMMRELPDATNMTDEQRMQFEELMNQRRETMRERMRERRQQFQEGGGEGMPPRDRDGHAGRPDAGAMRDEMFSDVAEILNEDQLELLIEHWAPPESMESVVPGVDTQSAQVTDDFRAVLISAKRVPTLTRQQKRLWSGIASEAMRVNERLRRSDKAGRASFNADVKAKIVDMLDKDQKEAFERSLEQVKVRKERGKHSRP